MEEGSQKIEICAKYPWGNELVEVLRLTENHPLLTSQQLQVKTKLTICAIKRESRRY